MPTTQLGTGQDASKPVSGPIGRVWNHILGQPDDAADTASATFDVAMVRAYVDERLGFAEGELFREKKLDGVAENLVSQLDTDGDGLVTWSEFQAFEGHILSMLAPGAEEPGADLAAVAGARFTEMASSGGGQATFDEIQAFAEAALPRGTDHAELIAQLGARMLLDAVDKDEGGTPIGERSLSREDWTGAATETAHRRR